MPKCKVCGKRLRTTQGLYLYTKWKHPKEFKKMYTRLARVGRVDDWLRKRARDRSR